ncbi:hypothetical protein [Thermospira aquatica]|uniref:Uncharacterized protein n=1 Tax=Thermospira aquatica TaxID=2828656 RepID=A0AAX3BBL6_9SPIR|nr:hypothetical protein [Thermospira aquatica]URA09466.1 hypothetical protein KDW03_08185 [Thermospira aquatica]
MKRCLLLCCMAGALYATDDLQVELKFYQQAYRINEDIPVQILVYNLSDKPQEIFVSPLIYETFFFDIRTTKNTPVELRDDFRVEKALLASDLASARQIILMPGESFSKDININEWFQLSEVGYYSINGLFYRRPDLTNEVQRSFTYKILIKPPQVVEEAVVQEDIKRQENFIALQKLPPYEVIANLWDAKSKKDWERFLFHIDAEKLLLAFDDFKGAYLSARTGRNRLQIVEDFKKYLTVHWQDRIISYSVKEAIIKGKEAEVVSDVEFGVRSQSYILRYTFKLYQNVNGQWLIYDYSVLRIK